MKNTGAIAKAAMPAPRAVTDAKALLDEAQDWWAWTWASRDNQARIRSAIETATAALDREIAKVRKSWNARAASRAVQSFKQAEHEFNRATSLAKKTFDEAEKEWNAAKAREGAVLAKEAIEKHEVLLALARSVPAD